MTDVDAIGFSGGLLQILCVCSLYWFDVYVQILLLLLTNRALLALAFCGFCAIIRPMAVVPILVHDAVYHYAKIEVRFLLISYDIDYCEKKI